MRRFGWTLVMLQVVAAAVFLVMAYLIEADLENAQVEKHANILSDPTLQRYRPDLVADALVEIRGERWAETLYLFLGFGAGGLALVSAVIMAATAVRPEHPCRSWLHVLWSGHRSRHAVRRLSRLALEPLVRSCRPAASSRPRSPGRRTGSRASRRSECTPR